MICQGVFGLIILVLVFGVEFLDGCPPRQGLARHVSPISSGGVILGAL